jgi:hypothetical protein
MMPEAYWIGPRVGARPRALFDPDFIMDGAA